MTGLGQRLHGLRWRLRAMRRLWHADAEPEMTFLPPSPVARIPVGSLDGPGQGTTVRRGALAISGWALFPAEPTVRVEILLGDELLGRARLGFLRPDVAESFEFPSAYVSGFQLTADLTAWRGEDGPATLRTIALSAAGERFELEPIRLTVAASKQAEPLPLPPPAPRTPRPQGDGERRLLVCTHQLDLGGAQLYLLDLLRELTKDESLAITVVSAIDGRTRKDIEDLGIPVHITSLVPWDDLSSHIGRVEELAIWAEGREFDVALVNTSTLLAFPWAEATALLGVPTVWTIHESFPPPILWSDLSPEIRQRADAALANAAVALFEAEATQRLYEPPLQASQSLTIPYGIDLSPIDAARTGFDRTAARREAGIPDDAEVLLCVGTIEPRKAQIALAQAFELIAGRNPDARLVFVGGSKKPDSLALAERIEASRWRERMELVPITPDVESWYGLSDFLVCASDVESLPRTVLEAMAWETPVLATDVFGLPELIDDGESGWLCEAGDITLLAEGLNRVLSTTVEEREKVRRTARSLVEERHCLERYGAQVSKLLQQAASGDVAAPDKHVAAP
jgi:glycosyltransferase involved in cell wall biosynthesis